MPVISARLGLELTSAAYILQLASRTRDRRDCAQPGFERSRRAEIELCGPVARARRSKYRIASVSAENEAISVYTAIPIATEATLVPCPAPMAAPASRPTTSVNA